jgi:hypothetical protein
MVFTKTLYASLFCALLYFQMFYLLIDMLYCNLQKQVMTARVAAKEAPSTYSEHDANISTNQT